MIDLLDAIRLAEAVEILVLILLLVYVGGQLSRPDSATHAISKRLAYIAFVVYAGAGGYLWGVFSAVDALVIVLRACLAAGLMFGVALVLLPAITAVLKPPKPKRKPIKPYIPPKPVVMSPKPAPPPTPAIDILELERKARVEDARGEVLRFYEQHRELMQETKPAALFRAEIETHFPAGIAPPDAWKAAQTLIIGMLPLIAAANETARAVKADEEKRQADRDAEEQKAKEAEQKGRTIERITEWYLAEKANIEATMPECDERGELLLKLRERQDQLTREALEEMQP